MTDRPALHRATSLTPRAEQTGDGLTIEGYLTVFDEVIRMWDPWTGDYFERIDPKAFNRSLKARTPIMLWNHGQDITGRIPIGVWESVKADERGLYGVGRLFDNANVQPVRDAIAGGAVTGQSITFYPVADKRTEDFQDGLPLITRKEVKLEEGGPVTMPAYVSTSVGVRSALAADWLTPSQRAEIERIIATSPDHVRTDPGSEPGTETETPEPSEATTSRDNATPEVVPLDPFVADSLRRNLHEEFNHDYRP